jgi:signal transduction histidine kinase
MPGASNRFGLAGALTSALVLAAGLPLQTQAQSSGDLPSPASGGSTITNLAQLCRALSSEERLYRDVRLEAVVCGSSRPGLGVLVVQDATGVELLELGRRTEEILPGEVIRIEGNRLLLRRRDLGTQITTAPLVDNDGLHGWRFQTNDVVLKAGPVPLELEWFNCLRSFGLEVYCQQSNGPPQLTIGSTRTVTWGSSDPPPLWHAGLEPSAAEANLVPGLQAECYEGYWEKAPDFDLLRPVKSGTSTNFDLGYRTRDELVGLRFTGFFQAPCDGTYTFRIGSDDGSLLFIGSPAVPVRRLGKAKVPAAQPGMIGEPMRHLEERRWLSLKGRVSFISRTAEGLVLELRSGTETVSVRLADPSGLEPPARLNTTVRALGVGRAALSANQQIVLDRLLVLDARGLAHEEFETETPERPLPLAPISQIQTMPVGDAQRQLPVRIRGVVTSSSRSDRWVSLQDDTRGIFVNRGALSNSFPARAELWEVVGHTAPGNFAPIVVAEEMKRLGQGRMPEPARPTWDELANGSMDVQWVEFRGLVTGVQSNRLTLLLPEGRLDAAIENQFESELKQFEQAVVRIRGTLFAIWNADTREVQFGSLLMRDASLSVDTPPPSDPFEAPTKTARDLLLFDAQATAFRPVKVRAQVLYADSQCVFAVDQGSGLRIIAPDAAKLQPGDLVEAVGYPEISGPSPLLRQAFVRKTGAAKLPQPKVLAGPELAQKGLDSMRVVVEGKLMGMHSEQKSPVLEIQSSGQLFVARIKPGARGPHSLRLGSQLQLCGVYAETGHNRRLGDQVGTFELLVNSPADIVVLSEPSWWTLERLGAVVGLLLVVLLLAAAWITQLQRQVEQRSAQLQQEMRERERAEHHQALEAERSRIARDLHDDLGSSLTEIGVLASTGQRESRVPSPESRVPTLRMEDASLRTTPDSRLRTQDPGLKTQDLTTLFDAIAGKARGSIAALDVIVWAVDPEANSLQSLADYLSGFAGEYLANSSVVCRFKIPVALPHARLEGRVRHDLFLAVKEALNNVVRHASATEVEFGVSVEEGALEIVIADNGKGFDSSLGPNGNGLNNLRARLTTLGGNCAIESRLGHGTTVSIRLPLPSPEPSADASSSDTTFDRFTPAGKVGENSP